MKFLKANEIDKNRSFVCGDRESDRQFAKNLVLTFISIKTNGNFYDVISALKVRGLLLNEENKLGGDENDRI